MRTSAIARLLVMGFLTLLLGVPLMWVDAIVGERASRRAGAVTEVSSTWAAPQTLAGPVLAVPYATSWVDNSGHLQRSIGRAYFLPRDVQIDARVATELRHRGIFDIPVYRSTIKVTGTFTRPDLGWVRPVPERIDWDRATVMAGVSDPRGIVRRAVLGWRGGGIPFEGGADDAGLFSSGLHAPIGSLKDVDPGVALPFEFTLELNGTRDLRFLPAAGETVVAMNATWPHPSFFGTALPDTRAIRANGFDAQWRVQDFARPYPAQWTSADMNREQLAARGNESAFGVSLIQPIDIYEQADRAVKYAALFIILTFLVFFLWEVFSATLLHPMQYIFIGFAMCVFYLLLLSISEHTGFDPAYAIAASATTLLIAGYARAALGGLKQGASVFGALASLYGFLYLLLRLEDYALLAGSIGLFIALAFVMFVTRRMNWYEMKLGPRPATSAANPAPAGPSA
jgi:inner membrane protein